VETRSYANKEQGYCPAPDVGTHPRQELQHLRPHRAPLHTILARGGIAVARPLKSQTPLHAAKNRAAHTAVVVNPGRAMSTWMVYLPKSMIKIRRE